MSKTAAADGLTHGVKHLAVVVVNYCTAALTIQCIEALAAARGTFPDLRVVVVDGASPDGSAGEIAAAIDTGRLNDWVTLLPLSVNGGFAFGNNQAFAARSNARIILLAVGSPQQELLAWEMREHARITGTALCIGASVDFLVGRQTRAPRIVQKAGMEWAWRLAGNPRRLARRYLIDGPAIFPMIWRWSRNRPRDAKSPS